MIHDDIMIIDNFIDLKYQEKIKNILLGEEIFGDIDFT